MDQQLLELIKSRRSIGKVKEEAPPKEMIEKLLGAATWAPNHYRVEPWRFVVLSGAGRDRLGNVFAEMALDGFEDPNSEEAERAVARARTRPLRAPYVITVIAEPPSEPTVVAVENVSAVAAASQNMLLLAHAMGLGVYWRTGDFAYDQRVRDFFQLEEGATIVGFLYVGYPDMKPPVANRIPHEQKTTWVDQ